MEKHETCRHSSYLILSVMLLSFQVSIVQLDEAAGELVLRNTFDHPYPATKLMWIPDSKGTFPDLIATSGDYLRLWRVSDVVG